MFTVKKYTMLFPVNAVIWAILFYFKFFGLTMAGFSGGPILRAVVLVTYILPIWLIGYYPSFANKRRSHVQPEEFFFTGQGYFEAAVLAALGCGLNWVHCPPLIKLNVFVAALPTIHFLFTRRINVETPELLHYPDLSRPLSSDERLE
ncbi:MAG TPA: hypothetical protein VKP58_15240 [Candidatus Acidoferrum sp.]|nr:hypothetical protein [Candidatus Acidoferrum sp.]